MMAPMANIILFEADDASDNLYTAVQTAANTPGVVAVSMSWSGPEFSGESSYDSTYFTTPPGHIGGSATLGGTGLPGNVTFLAATGDYGPYAPGTTTLTPQYPAASPNVVAVGGTTLSVNGNAYGGETAWGNGTDSGFYYGGGGGISAFESQPAYQKGVVNAFSTVQRTYPDVAADADPGSGVSIYDTYDFGSSTPWATYGGTSLACPLWAGIVAVADEGRAIAGKGSLDGPSQTLPQLYKLPAADFNDITTGNNGYLAGPGYDLATGIGTPVANLLVPALMAGPVVSTAAAANPNPVTGKTTNLSVLGAESGSNVQLTYTWSATTVPEIEPNVGATPPTFSPNGTTAANDTIATFHAAGTYVLTAMITDQNGLSVPSSVSVTVNQSLSAIAVSPAPATLSVAARQNFTALALDQFGGALSSQPSSFTWTTTVGSINSATGRLTAPGSPGSGIVTATSGTVTGTSAVTVTNLTTTTLAASSATPIFGQPLTLTATITVISPGTGTPNGGTVTFRDGNNVLGSAPVSAAGTATFSTTSLAAGSLSVGLHLLTASYSGSLPAFGASSTTIGTSSLITTVAGGGNSGDHGPPTAAELYNPTAVAVDASGNLFIADANHNRVREVNASTGLITTVAGNGTLGFSGDSGPATAAQLDFPTGVALDQNNDLFIADEGNQRIREVNLLTGLITTAAGNGTAGFSGDTGPATAAELDNPFSVAADQSGNLFIADTSNNRVRQVNLVTKLITTVAGTGIAGYNGDSGLAAAAELCDPYGVAVDQNGHLFIADTSNQRIRQVDLFTKLITTVAGIGTAGYGGDGGLATAAGVNYPYGVAVDQSGDLFIADGGNNRVREVNASTKLITTVAGNGTAGYSGDGGQATAAGINAPYGVAVDQSGHLFIADTFNDRIREVNLAQGLISTAAGNGIASYSGDNGQATAAVASYPLSVAIDGSGHLFIADTGNNVVREVNLATGIIATVAGNGTYGYNGDNCLATAAELASPQGIAVDQSGHLFIADTGNQRIREVNLATGLITTLAGNGITGYGGDAGLATVAELDNPMGIAVDNNGHLFIADADNNVIREVNLATGLITTVAGDGTAFYGGDGGPATAAELYFPTSVAVDQSGHLFIADTFNQVIREVNLATGLISTLAGDGFAGYYGDSGQAAAAEINNPYGVAVDQSGHLFIADTFNQRIREVNLATGLISTVAGDGTAGDSGDNAQATAAELDEPAGIAVDAAGNCYFVDYDNQRIARSLPARWQRSAWRCPRSRSRLPMAPTTVPPSPQRPRSPAWSAASMPRRQQAWRVSARR